MRRVATVLLLLVPLAGRAEPARTAPDDLPAGRPCRVLVLADGTRLPVREIDASGRLVVFVTAEGERRSVARELVDLAATEAAAPTGTCGAEAEPAPPRAQTAASPVAAPSDDLPRADLPAATPSPSAALVVPPPPELPATVARDEAGRVTVRAVRLDAPLVVDGRLEEAIYRRIRPIDGFVQQVPDEGAPATEPTEVWILFDEANVYVAARCWDSHPERMVANEMRRDHQNIINNENFAVIFDTFFDRRNGFLFHTNPLGALWDGQVTDEGNVNSDWNTVWHVKTARFEKGWTVEMAIPFKSLRYKGGGAQIWGVNFRRIVRWKNEWTYLTPIPAAYDRRGLIKLSSAATLVGIEPPARTMNLEVKPYATAGLRTDRTATPVVSNELDPDTGVDVKYGLTRSLVLDLTYNTDFAQVEDDEQQVNLTRFSLFFPEKREFFLEGQGIFAFGGVEPRRRPGEGAEDAPILFFSRRIGLAEGEAVPIQGGGRITGRAGRYSLGLLNIRTGAMDELDVPATTFSVVRIKRDVLRRSNVGILATHRSHSLEGEGSNAVFGADANFSLYENVEINTYYARSRTPGLEGEDESYRGRFAYRGDRYGLTVEHLAVGENFNPEVGFLRREDMKKSFAEVRFSPRPRSIEAVRKLSYEGRLNYITDGEGRLETREVELQFRAEMENSDFFNVRYTRSFEFLDEPFEIADEVVLPVGSYHFQNLSVGYWFGRQRPVSGWLGVERGSFFSGDRTELSAFGRVELGPRFTLEPTVSINWVDLPEGAFTTRLARLRANYTFTPRTFVAALVQYNSSSDSLSTNVRFRWEYEPGSDLFVVYSDVRDTDVLGFPAIENRSFIVKFTRLLRF